MKREEEEKSVSATYVIERSYPRIEMRPQLLTLWERKMDDRTVRLDIETEEKLPDEFFTELDKLVGKYANNQ